MKSFHEKNEKNQLQERDNLFLDQKGFMIENQLKKKTICSP